MKKYLTSSGTGWNLYLPKPILQLVGFEPPLTKVLFTMKNNILYIEKIGSDEESKYKGLLVRNLHKVGNGYGVFMPQPIIELLGVNPETDQVEYEVNEHVLTIKKAETK